ncbi:MAG: cation:proton antiporter [Clostridia bacterium]|nr:cation:proton antiporter [Clostridia bacterium]
MCLFHFFKEVAALLNGFYTRIAESSPTAVIIIAVSIMLFSGFAMTRITKLLRLPNVTAYIIAGILIGPFCLDLVPRSVVEGTDFISDIALAFIAFSVGEFFKVSSLKKNGIKTIVITLFEAIFAAVLVFFLTFFVLKLDMVFSVVLSALAAATAPTSTAMTIRQSKAKGEFVDTLLQVIALDDVFSLIAFSIALSVAGTLLSDGGDALSVGTVIMPIVINIGVMILGAFFGWILKFLMPAKRTTDNRLIILISMLFVFCGICALLDISPLLGCITMGMVYINVSGDDKLYKQLNYFSPPVMLLFFVRSGLNLQIDSFFTSTGSSTSVPIIMIAILYFFVRMIGKYGGAFLGCLCTGRPARIRNYLGLALIPQAGVAIGLAAMAARSLGGEVGENLQTIILASSILYELIGPACAKLSLFLSGSISDSIEEIAPVEVTDENGVPKSEVEILIERINKIREELPEPEKPEISPEEQAFLEAADEQFEALSELQRRRFRNRR